MARKKIAFRTSEKSLDQKINANFSDNALKMMKKRYLLKREGGAQETPADMFRRVARALASVEKKYGRGKDFMVKTERDFFEIMSRKEYTPAGRTLTNVGTGTPLIANCIVLPVLDSMESIFGTLKDAALLQQAGSGLGFDFSHLRPAMSPTKKSRGVSSGPVSFLKVYNEAFGVIKQQSRSGANMAMMLVSHPDVLDFIRAKEIEGEIRNFNISVKVTDEFMKALETKPNEQWYCEWNGKKMKPRRVLRARSGSVIGVEEIDITVKEFFDELVHYAWLNGEPGIVFIDEVNRTNPLPGLGEIDCSNPCVIGETLVPTEKGLLTMEELAASYPGGNINIATDSRAYEFFFRAPASGMNSVSVQTKTSTACSVNTASKIWMSGIKPVYRLTTESGYELTATADHKVLTTEGKVEISKLTKKHLILIQPGEGVWSTNNKLPFEVVNLFHGNNGRTYTLNLPNSWSKELGQMLGWLVGDGWVRDKEKQHIVGFTFSKEDQTILEYLKPIINRWYNGSINEVERENGVFHLNYGSKFFVDYIKALGVKTARAEEKEVPRALFTAPRDTIVGFLQGLFGADGTAANDEKKGSRYIRLTSKSQKLLQQVQVILLNFGIKSRIYDRSRSPRILFPYITKAGEKRHYLSDGVLYELQISKQSLPKFVSEIGFIGDKHRDKIEKFSRHDYYREHFTETVKSVAYIGERKVYDLTEPATTTFIANGFSISNCGEQFLHHYDNCNLGSINLALFVKNGKVDWDRLRRVTRTATRLMDNVIDLFDFPVQKVTDLARKNRRIGLGIMGFADMLYQLGISYNSTAGRALGERVMKAINESAHEMSRELAREKGAFPNLPLSVFAKQKIKMRNAALTTVAPTGSISMMLDCSSGIEPNFALAYVKQDKDGHQYHYFNRFFEAALEKRAFPKEKVREIKEEIIKTGGIQRLTDLPKELRDTFIVAMDISAEDHTQMQAAFQRNVDNSISKTINFPNSATKDDVANGYRMAWKLKCKSATVYRDGSRSVQILNLGTGENIKAPSDLPTARISETAAPAVAPLGLPIDKNRLEPRLRPSIMNGRTYKIKTGYGNLYITINDDEQGVPFEIFAAIGKSGGFFQEQSEAICRMISLALRSGVKVETIIEQLKGIRGPMPVLTDKGTVLSLPDAIGQLLEEHVKNKAAYEAEAKELVAVALPDETKRKGAAKMAIADYGFMPGCPDCGAHLQMGEGCLSCRSCGFSRCL